MKNYEKKECMICRIVLSITALHRSWECEDVVIGKYFHNSISVVCIIKHILRNIEVKLQGLSSSRGLQSVSFSSCNERI